MKEKSELTLLEWVDTFFCSRTFLNPLRKKKNKPKQNTSLGHLRLSRSWELMVPWRCRTQGQRSPLILYQLIPPPDPLFVSFLLSVGDASQSTIPLGECLTPRLSVCVWVLLTRWFELDSLRGRQPRRGVSARSSSWPLFIRVHSLLV